MQIYRRLILSWWDFYRAAQFAELLLESWQNDDADETAQVAFTIAAVISYARPFSGNRKTEDTIGRFPKELVDDVFEDRDQKLHEHLVRMRNKEFAHTDADAADLSVSVSEFRGEKVPVPTMRNPMVPLGPEITEHLRAILTKLIRVTHREKRRIEEDFDVGEEV